MPSFPSFNFFLVLIFLFVCLFCVFCCSSNLVQYMSLFVFYRFSLFLFLVLFPPFSRTYILTYYKFTIVQNHSYIKIHNIHIFQQWNSNQCIFYIFPCKHTYTHTKYVAWTILVIWMHENLNHYTVSHVFFYKCAGHPKKTQLI